MDTVSPGHPRARAALDLLERALPLLPRLPSAIEQALAALSLFLDEGARAADRLAALDAAIGHVVAAEGELPAGRALEAARRAAELLRDYRADAIEELTRREERLLRAAPAGEAGAASRPGRRPLRASIGVPSLHVLERSPLALVAEARPAGDTEDTGDADEADEAPDSAGDEDAEAADVEERGPDSARYAELLSWVRDGAAVWGGDDADAVADVRRLARDCMEDIGSFSSLRKVNEGEPWPSAVRFEQRLLDNLDALIALSTGVPGHDGARSMLAELARYAAEVSFDQGRAFTLAFVLGCIDGPEAVRAIVLALRRATTPSRAAYREALSLAPHPGIAGAMRRLLDDEDPALAALALSVLRFRRDPAFGGAIQLLHHPDPEVAKAAARCLAVAPRRAPAIRALEQRLDACDDDRIGLTLAESLLALGAPSGLAYARRCVSSAIEGADPAAAEVVIDAARLVALAGEARDAELLGAAAQRYPGCTESLGWLGQVGLVDALLGTLDRALGSASERSLAAAASGAITRIVGAGPGAPPLDDLAGFRAWWQKSRDRFPPAQKHRFEALFTPFASLEELEAEATAERARARAALEIAIALGAPSALEITDWVARQRAELAQVRRRFEGGEVLFVPGQWPRQWLGDGQR